METIRIEFDFSDKDIAEIISSSKPPDGATVGKPAVFIKASADNGGVFTQLAIQIAQDIHEIGILVLAQWLYECCKKSGKKKGRINRSQIVFNKRNISRLIKKELKEQNAGNAQRQRDKNRLPKKRS